MTADYVTADCAAGIVQRHKSFILAAVRAGYLRAIKLKPVLVSTTEVEALLASLDRDKIRAIEAFRKKRPS
jgi:hypothetical protein